uniref:Uncharacterized protein n=1 Tax=Zea mays TaxID=4577 RepID=B6U920_MAIZE|nr:hypothetical protein [Zea mays]
MVRGTLGWRYLPRSVVEVGLIASRGHRAAVNPRISVVQARHTVTAEEPMAEDPGVQQVEVVEQELIEGDEQVAQEEPHNKEFDLI